VDKALFPTFAATCLAGALATCQLHRFSTSISRGTDLADVVQILDTCMAWADGEHDGLTAERLEAGVGMPRQDLLLHPGNLVSTPDDSLDD